jgi:hemerythrin
MEEVPWKSSFATGFRAIDDDHKMLFSIVNNLIAETKAGEANNPRQIESLLEALENYVDTHFTREEQFLEKFGYPDLDAHRDSHDAFRHQIDTISKGYKLAADSVDLEKVCAFLVNWLSKHILVSDMEYVPYLKGEKKGAETDSRSPMQPVTVSVPAKAKNLIHELAYHLRRTPDVDKAVQQFNEARTGDAQKRTPFQKS